MWASKQLFWLRQDLAELAQAAAANGADALGMAGGDGSLAIMAGIAAAREIPFVCVPAGTRNHFALDLGVDRRDLIGALRAVTDGVEREINLGEVNGRLFMNNVSLGIYGDAVQRTAYRDAKVRTILDTARQVLGPSARLPHLTVTDKAGREHRQPAVVLISNNPYALDQPLARGTRPALHTGQLGILVLDGSADRPHLPACAWTAAQLEVSAPAAVNAGIDGEAADLAAPLRFSIRPGSLRVRISAIIRGRRRPRDSRPAGQCQSSSPRTRRKPPYLWSVAGSLASVLPAPFLRDRQCGQLHRVIGRDAEQAQGSLGQLIHHLLGYALRALLRQAEQANQTAGYSGQRDVGSIGSKQPAR